jgi:hypothetical protein
MTMELVAAAHASPETYSEWRQSFELAQSECVQWPNAVTY